ncbi:MAG TPA: DinB family protein [Acidimicrobiales bacterium]|nr:DinB family protein [Acidimicrobiales bacterium]
MERALGALRASVGRLHQLCRGLDDTQLAQGSYCRDRSIAEVLGHLGSSAVIWCRRLDDTLAGRATPDAFAPAVWEEWDAKLPRSKVDDALVEDEGLLERLEGLDQEDRARLALPMGPMTLSFGQVVAFRLNEHALHTWDVEVVFDDHAHLPEDAAAVVVDHLAPIVGFTARPAGAERRVAVRTSHPARDFTLHLTREGAELAVSSAPAEPDLELPAEAFCRLVYGRLDEDHCPPVRADGGVLDLLRQVFPGP